MKSVLLVLYSIIVLWRHVKHKWMSISMFSDAEQMTERNFDLTNLSCHVNYAAFTRKLLASDMWMMCDDLWFQRRQIFVIDFIHRNRNLGVDWFAGFRVTFHQLYKEFCSTYHWAIFNSREWRWVKVLIDMQSRWPIAYQQRCSCSTFNHAALIASLLLLERVNWRNKSEFRETHK